MHTGSRSRAGWAVAALVTMTLTGWAPARQPAPMPTPSPTATSSTVPTAPTRHFVSRPDLTPPVVTSTAARAGLALPGAADTGDVFLGPKDLDTGLAQQGELIVDQHGQPVWVAPSTTGTFDFREQTYRGAPVLTYWSGSSSSYGHGDVVVLDQTYTPVATVTTGGDLGPHQADMHETTITPQGTMLLTSYPEVRADLSGVGGPKDGWVLEGVAQEVDIATGRVLFEWRSLDHVPISDTFQPLSPGQGTQANPFDYLHMNSVSQDGPDHLLISARNTHTVYEVARQTGAVTWRLGGRRSSFTVGPGAAFAWQHDARRQADGTLTVFDNEAAPTSSRGLRLSLDTSTMTATLVVQYLPPAARAAATQGDVQVLPDGNVMVGWGQEPFYSEYTAAGQLIWDATFTAGTSYRAFLAPWTGTPAAPPDAVIERAGSAGTVYASWNGATQVASWRVLTGPDAADAAPAATVPRTGFETAIPVRQPGSYVEVQALDATGAVLRSTVVR